MSEHELEAEARAATPSHVLSMLRELRARRSRDLNPEDVLALEDARDFIADSDTGEWNVDYGGSKVNALAVLDKILQQQKEP